MVSEYVTKADLEQRLKLHRNTLSRFLAQGRFPNAIRAGGRWRIPVTDVQAFIQANRAGSREEAKP